LSIPQWEMQRGADVGTNLIDGHSTSGTWASLCRQGADVGTNLIDGHCNPYHNDSPVVVVPTSAPT